jgi:hypothetical protein
MTFYQNIWPIDLRVISIWLLFGYILAMFWPLACLWAKSFTLVRKPLDDNIGITTHRLNDILPIGRKALG